MITRTVARENTARYLNSLSKDELFNRFEITRIGNITGYDILGIPVYSSCRPASKTVSVSAGKSMVPAMARAGAIAEGIEFHTFENPKTAFSVERVTVQNLPTVRGCSWKPSDPIPVDTVTHYLTGSEEKMPAEMVWLRERKHFLDSSNGQALGGSFGDAFVQGLYEVVERDQITLRRIAMEHLGVFPPRIQIDLHLPHPKRLTHLVASCAAASLKLHLLFCSSDIRIPVYTAILTDPYGGVGAFSGCGAHLSHEIAAERAILEAIQCRAVYVSGARDDILRRDFKTLKEKDPCFFSRELEKVPAIPFPASFPFELSVEDELTLVLHKLSKWGRNIYFKHVDLGDLHAVKTIVIGMECPKFTGEKAWRPIRFSMLAQAFMDVARNQGLENSGVVQQLKAISFETLSI